MGFNSKTCAKSHLPVTVEAKNFPAFNRVVALLPDGRIVRGSYDGYCRVNGESLYEDESGNWIWDEVKFVLEPHYNGETYDQLPHSGDELSQGYFMDRQFLLYCHKKGGFKTRAAYVRAFKKYANW